MLKRWQTSHSFQMEPQPRSRNFHHTYNGSTIIGPNERTAIRSAWNLRSAQSADRHEEAARVSVGSVHFSHARSHQMRSPRKVFPHTRYRFCTALIS
jgi:hypothetical protein